MPFSISAPTLQEKTEYMWDGMSQSDIPEMWNLLQVVNRVDDNDHSHSIGDLEREFDDPWSNPARDGRIIRTLMGKLAAFARIFVNPQPEHENVAVLWCEVEPEAREDGLEQECVEWMEERARERLDEVATTPEVRALPRVIRTFVPETARDAVILYERNGYRSVRAFFKMERNLHDPIPAKTLPDGLVLRTYSEDIDEPMRQAMNESFRDHWGHQDITAQEWHPFIMDSSDVRRDLTLVVMDGDEVAALCINQVRQLENERLNIQRGWVGTLGTRRAYRHRGIASFLLAESMRRFRAEGFDSIGLGVDAENLTGALALYEGLGFKPIKTRLVLEKKVR